MELRLALAHGAMMKLAMMAVLIRTIKLDSFKAR